MKSAQHNIEIPDEYEEITDKRTILENGDKYYSFWLNEFEKIGLLSQGKPRASFSSDSILIRPKPLTLEDKIKANKKKAHNFVNKNIKNPTAAIYKRFEEVFMREDNFGL